MNPDNPYAPPKNISSPVNETSVSVFRTVLACIIYPPLLIAVDWLLVPRLIGLFTGNNVNGLLWTNWSTNTELLLDFIFATSLIILLMLSLLLWKRVKIFVVAILMVVIAELLLLLDFGTLSNLINSKLPIWYNIGSFSKHLFALFILYKISKHILKKDKMT